MTDERLEAFNRLILKGQPMPDDLQELCRLHAAAKPPQGFGCLTNRPAAWGASSAVVSQSPCWRSYRQCGLVC